MALRLSTGLRQILLGSADFRSTFVLTGINLYTGSQPASADDAITATLLAPVTLNDSGVGVSFDAPIAGVIAKAVAEICSGTALATGTAGWFRMFVIIEDPATLDTVKARMDGAIATSGGELNMSSTAVVVGAVQTITNFTVTLPAS